jgi:hypothetical protein
VVSTGALPLCGSALGLCEEIDDGYGQAATHDSIGLVNHRLGLIDEAVYHLGRAVELLHPAGDRYCEARALENVGDARHTAAEKPSSVVNGWRRSGGIAGPSSTTPRGPPNWPSLSQKTRTTCTTGVAQVFSIGEG